MTTDPSCKDEARVGQKGSLEYIWAPVGSRPPMVRDNRHDSAYLFGAICHARKVGAAIIMPSVNAEAMSEHLKEISTQIALGAHAVVVCDGAGWHQSGGRLRLPHNITLLPLPPYAPELNPMENIWDYLRGNKLSKRVWNSDQEIVAACKDAWLFLLGDPKRIDTIAIVPAHGSMFESAGIRPRTKCGPCRQTSRRITVWKFQTDASAACGC